MAPPLLGWDTFFGAQVGAAATLSGLVFVAVSISLRAILASAHLRYRAIETLMTFLLVLAVATCALVPRQDARWFGGETAALGAWFWLVATRRHRRAHRDPELEPEARHWLWLRVLGTQASCIPFIVAGGLLLLGRGHGIYRIVPGVLASFATGAFNAWVLLVEIQR